MFQPVCLENKKCLIHPFRLDDMKRYDQLVKDICQLLSDDDTLYFIPEKRIRTLTDAEIWLKAAILNFHCGRNFIHFITDKISGKLIGIIDILSPEIAMDNYQLDTYPYFIEFYLAGTEKGKKIMSGILPDLITELRNREIIELGAVVNRRNIAAMKVLTRTGFQYHSAFDVHQDLYQISIHPAFAVRKAS